VGPAASWASRRPGGRHPGARRAGVRWRVLPRHRLRPKDVRKDVRHRGTNGSKEPRASFLGYTART
jgi:hypothetical protein